jgi:hypothetical protein
MENPRRTSVVPTSSTHRHVYLRVVAVQQRHDLLALCHTLDLSDGYTYRYVSEGHLKHGPAIVGLYRHHGQTSVHVGTYVHISQSCTYMWQSYGVHGKHHKYGPCLRTLLTTTGSVVLPCRKVTYFFQSLCFVASCRATPPHDACTCHGAPSSCQTPLVQCDI